MFSCVRNLSRLTSHIVRNCELQSGIPKNEYIRDILSSFCGLKPQQCIHSYSPRMKDMAAYEIRRAVKEAEKKRSENLGGETSQNIDFFLKSQQEIFPTHDLPTRLFDGVPFKDIPIIHVKATKNNTIMSLVDKGNTKLVRSCGQEGFKNTRKGTNLAGQTVGLSLGMRAAKKGFKNVRVLVKGLGPGRLSALKGLQLGGLNIISITDRSADRTSFRPKKQRRL